MKLRVLIIAVMSMTLLQACQHSNDTNDEASEKKKHRSEAAGYNVQLGLGYLSQGNIPRAKRKLLLALEQAPNSPDANAAMAYFMEKTGTPEVAKTYYQKAMSVAPGRGSQLNNYGAFLCRQGAYAEAETYFLKAVSDPQYEHTAGAYENAGLCALAIPDAKKAEQFFSKALKQDPSRKQSLAELVQLEIKHSQFDEALANLQKHPDLVLHSPDMLAFAVETSHQLGKSDLEAEYKNWQHLLEPSGVKHHDVNNNG